MVKYEGKAAAALDSTVKASDGQAGARVTFLLARNGVDISAGNDRRITSELVDFDVAADTAMFQGKVVATQDKNVLKGERLFVDRKAGTSRLEPADGGRIAATFYQAAGAEAHRTKPQPAAEAFQSISGSFKNDPNAPMEVEASTLDVVETAKKAVFKGDVRARQGEMLLLASELAAFYAGPTGLGAAIPADDPGAKAKGQNKGQILRLEARNEVLLTSKDGLSASAKSAIFDVRANTALLVGDVLVTKPASDPQNLQRTNVLEAPRLKIDLTTGVYWMEAGPSAARGPSPPELRGPAVSSNPPATSSGDTPKAEGRTCAPGKACGLIYPNQVKDRALDVLKKKVPGVDAR
jgi:lipopolysaccharide export system protein LptA